jgi:histidine ammonia-lyase
MVRISGHDLSVAQIAGAATTPARVELTDDAALRVKQSHERAMEISALRPIYGRTTGVGANRGVLIEPSIEQAQSLLRSHATAAGPPRSPERVRAMLLIRLNQLCAGGAGIRPAVVNALADMISADELPLVREHAGVGTGDLSALATTALAMQERSTRVGGEPLLLGPHDALSFMSSNAAALGDAALALNSLSSSTQSALAAAALSFTALDGNTEAYAEAVDRVTPMVGAIVTCRAMRSLVGSGRSAPPRIQDPYGLRALPQSHGVLLDALAALRDTVTAYVNAPSENPVVLPDGSVAHHGGFHASYLAIACDMVRIAAVQSGQLVMHRLTYLSEPSHTQLPAFLGNGTPGASGVMGLEYVAAAALGDLRSYATPASLQTANLSRGVEDAASFASLAARQMLGSADCYELLVAAELLGAVRANRMRGAMPTGLLADVMAACESLPSDNTDRDLTVDLDIARSLVAGLARYVELELPVSSWENDI